MRITFLNNYEQQFVPRARNVLQDLLLILNTKNNYNVPIEMGKINKLLLNIC